MDQEWAAMHGERIAAQDDCPDMAHPHVSLFLQEEHEFRYEDANTRWLSKRGYRIVSAKGVPFRQKQEQS